MNSFDENEIKAIYEMIKCKLIETNTVSATEILTEIIYASKYNNQYLKTYWVLFKMIFEEYQIKFKFDSDVFKYFVIQEYKVNDQNIDTSNGYSLDVHERDTIYRAIMEDDIESFKSFTTRDEFDINQKLESKLYPKSKNGLSFLELCCYHGSINCFRFLRSEFKSKITPESLQLSFLGKNDDILKECLNTILPTQKCMKYAIISHNVELVYSLVKDYKLNIAVEDCCKYNNVAAFFLYLWNQNYPVPIWFAYSVYFNIAGLWEYFVSDGADVNYPYQYGITALHEAVNSNCYKLADYLISHGADVNAKDNYGKTILHVAAFQNDVEKIRYLISNGANVNATDNNKRTPLHYAAKNCRKEAFEFLISHGADVNAKDEYGLTPLHDVSSAGNVDYAKILVSSGADVNQKNSVGWTAMYYAVVNQHIRIARLLASYKADVNTQDVQGKSLLHWETTHFNKKVFEILIKNRADVNARDNDGSSVLCYAIRSKCTEMVSSLLYNGAYPNDHINGKTALQYTIENGYIEMARMLVHYGADIPDNFDFESIGLGDALMSCYI